MQLSHRQTVLIAVLSGVVLILAVAAALIFTSGDECALPGPSPSPPETALPSPTPSPAATPTPTVFLLPLVPRWDTPRPAEGL